MDLSRDAVVNVVYRGIKADIRLLLEHEAYRGAILLTYAGMDAMAFVSMPAHQAAVRSSDFIAWADRYIRFPCGERISGEELYSARCATLHTYGTESRLTRSGAARQVGYMSDSIPEVRAAPAISRELVLVSVPALATAFFEGVDGFLVDVFADSSRATVAEARLAKLMHILEREAAEQTAGLPRPSLSETPPHE
jgi:hypothetical protein